MNKREFINFIDKSNSEDLNIKYEKIIESQILQKEKYFDPTLHHLIITPYLLESNYLTVMFLYLDF